MIRIAFGCLIAFAFLGCDPPLGNISEMQSKKIDLARLENLSAFSDIIGHHLDDKEYSKVIPFIDSALTYAKHDSEIVSLYTKKAHCFFSLSDYEKAIEVYTILLNANISPGENYLNRAKCYILKQDPRQAVNDLVESIHEENREAESLYEFINPLKKRVSHYVVKCCDGTMLSKEGSNTCSFHGGVCDTSIAVYKDYRKY